jgi:hypothetical protein
MHQNPSFGTVQCLDPNQFVNVLGAQLRVPDHFLQFFVQEFKRLRPIDVSGYVRETELKERPEVHPQGFLPSSIVIVPQLWHAVNFCCAIV